MEANLILTCSYLLSLQFAKLNVQNKRRRSIKSSAQDKSSFWFSHILNEILQYTEIWK